MTVRVEKLEAPAPSVLALAVFAMLTTATTALVRWWQRPNTLVMSDAWLSEHARTDSKQGWD